MRLVLPLFLLLSPILSGVPPAFYTPRSYDLISDGEIKVSLPRKPLAAEALEVRSLSDRQHFTTWNSLGHSTSFDFLQRLGNHYFTCYTVHGKTTPSLKGEMFTWQMIPKNNLLACWVRTGQTFYRMTFGSRAENPSLEDKHQEVIRALNRPTPLLADEAKQDDPFCDPSVIERQLVWEGKTVWLLRDYSQNLLIEETPHFLIIAKKHRTTFSHLRKEEYLEAMETAQKVATYFGGHFPNSTLHLYHNNGEIAGQVVPHWHLHIVALKEDFSNPNPHLPYQTRWAEKLSDFCAKWKQFLCLSLPRRGLSPTELAGEVEHWKKEFKNMLD